MKKLYFSFLFGCVLSCPIAAQTIIREDTTYNFSQAPSSTVRYNINIWYPGEYTMRIRNWLSTYDWTIDYDRLYIYNDSLAPIGIGAFGSSSDPYLFHMFQDTVSILTFRVGQAGVYSIDIHSGQIKDWGGATSQNYTLTIDAKYCNDTFEPNDDIHHAASINLGQKVVAYQWRRVKNEYVSGDEDWYGIQINGPGQLTIHLMDWVGTYNWETDYDCLHVYNGNGQEIGFAGGYSFYSWMMGTGTDTVAIPMNLSHASTYYLRFHSGNGTSTHPYSFITSFVPANDPFEPNDDFTTAKLISCDTTYQACEWRTLDTTMNVAGDEDYYYFNASQAGNYTLSINNWMAILDWGADYDRLWVYNESKTILGADPFDWMMHYSPEINTIPIPAPGKYYIRMHCGGTYSLNGYSFHLTSPGTSVKEQNDIPLVYSLTQNFPNPFNPSTTISFSLPSRSFVSLKIFDLTGKEVAAIVSEEMQPGKYSRQWNASDLSSGIYFYRLQAGSFAETKKLIVLK
jgi:Secretion system C-terminal sorting domain